MTRHQKKKVGHGNHADLISDLPRNVINGILEHLPLQDAVRTSILSRKWRYMWVSVPQLEFDKNFFHGIRNTLLGDNEIPSVITGILLLHKGPLYKFAFDIPSDFPIRIKCLNLWILFLSRSGIKDLVLENQQSEEDYQMPSHLFSCQELTHMDICNFRLSLPTNFCGFKNLLGLRLYGITFQSSELESLISGCPLLDKLTIAYCSGFESLNVSASTLRSLNIGDFRVIKPICLEKAKNLVDLTIMITRSMENIEEGRCSDFINFFSCLPKIERLCLIDGYIKILSAGSIPESLPTLSNLLKLLELDDVNFNSSQEILFIVCLIKSSPNLDKLVIKSRSMANGLVPEHLKVLDCNRCCFSQLRTVNIQVKTAFQRGLDLARFLLANSPSLEVLTFKVGFIQSKILFNISQDLLKMGRASARAEIKFLYDGPLYNERI